MAYSEYPPTGPASSGTYEGGYSEYPYSGGGGAQPPPEEQPEEDLGYFSPKVELLRRIKAIVLVVEVLVMVVLVYIGYAQRMSNFENFSQKPWFPLAPALFWLLLMGVVMVMTGIIFRSLEIKLTESGSQKVLLAQSAFRAALTSMIVATVFLAVILYLPTAQFVKDGLLSKDESTKETTDFKYKFKSQDEFQVTRVTAVTVTMQYPEDVALVKKEAFEDFTREYQAFKNGSRSWDKFQQFLALNNTNLTLNIKNYTNNSDLSYGEWYVYIIVQSNSSGRMQIQIQREIQPDLLFTLTIFLAILAVMDGAWMVAALVIKQKYKGYSIYT